MVDDNFIKHLAATDLEPIVDITFSSYVPNGESQEFYRKALDFLIVIGLNMRCQTDLQIVDVFAILLARKIETEKGLVQWLN